MLTLYVKKKTEKQRSRIVEKYSDDFLAIVNKTKKESVEASIYQNVSV